MMLHQMRHVAVSQRPIRPLPHQSHRLIPTLSASSKYDTPVSNDAATITTTITAVICLSSLISEAAPASAKFACAATALATWAAGSILAPADIPPSGQKPRPDAPQTATGDSSTTTTTSSSSSSSRSSTAITTPLPPQLEALVELVPPDARTPLAAAAAAVVISAVVPGDALPAVSSLCLLAYVWTFVDSHQQKVAATAAVTATAVAAPAQQQQQHQRQQQKQLQQQLQQQLQEQEQQQKQVQEQEQELQKQLQRKGDQVRNLTARVEQLQRELRQERKGTARLAKVQEQLKAEQAARQDLATQVMLLQYQLQTTQQQLEAAEQAAGPKAESSPAATPKQQQPNPGTQAAAGAAAAAPVRVAFVGGRGMKESDKKLLPVNSEVRFFGSPRDTGTGQIKSLEAAIKAGSIDEVYLLTRWNGHGTTQKVRKLCKDRGIPCFLLDAGEKVARKAEWAESVTSSSDDGDSA